MNEKESLALFAKGHDAWNEWAEKMLAERAALEAAGVWTDDTGEFGPKFTDAARAWLAAATATFTEHKFEEETDFSAFNFPGEAQFDEATFSGYARFAEATFSGDAVFREATFSGGAWFDDATFSGNVWFGEATFPGSAVFSKATFSGDAWFGEATFSGDAWFDDATFSGDAGFLQCAFDGFTEFEGATFEEAAGFSAIEGRSAFSLGGARFRAVPDFIQAHFGEAPRLDNIRIKSPRFWPSAPVDDPKNFKGDPDISARWRALKRLAIQGHDHVREQTFFKNEIISRRGSTDKLWNAVFWFGLLYQGLSDFGRSLLRPLLWWGAGVAGFAVFYLGQRLDTAKIPVSGFDWATPLSCVAGPGDSRWAAIGLSVRKALLFVGQGSTSKLDQIYACLYGIHADPKDPVVSGNLPTSFTPVIPDSVAFLGLGQTLLSAVLIFLFLLAVRNHFRIK